MEIFAPPILGFETFDPTSIISPPWWWWSSGHRSFGEQRLEDGARVSAVGSLFVALIVYICCSNSQTLHWSMSDIYAYIDFSNHPNVSKYGIHGVPGIRVVVCSK